VLQCGGMPRLGAARQGESRLRFLRVIRRGDRHDARDLTISISFEGDFANAFTERRADGAIPREALKSLIHHIVREESAEEIESLALATARRVLRTYSAISRVRVDVAEQPWARMSAGGKLQGQAFVQGGPEQRTAAVVTNGTHTSVVAGIDQLMVMRTAGFLPSRTVRADDGLEDAVQPLLVGGLSAKWTYGHADVAFGSYRQGVRAALTDAFALHATESVQHTLYAIAGVVLATYEDILDVTLALHERQYRPTDTFTIAPAVEDLFLVADEPVRVVEVTVERESARRG
jgi:urate oxidase